MGRRQGSCPHTAGERPEPISENDEGTWEWTSLWPQNTGLPFKIWICDIAPAVVVSGTPHCLTRAEMNQLFRWIALNANALADAQIGKIDTAELVLRRLQRLP